MERIRGNHYLSTDVERSASIEFLERVISRCQDLVDELSHELVKHGEKG